MIWKFWSFGILFITIIACPSIAHKGRKKKPKYYNRFPIQGNETDMIGPVHVFEGVDYDLLPPGFSSIYSDCEAVQQKCLADQPYLIPVCAREWNPWRWRYFDNQCEMLRENCYTMVRQNMPKEGRNFTEGHIYYIADGYHPCEYYNYRAHEAIRKGQLNQDIPIAPTTDFMLEEMKKRENKTRESEKEIFNNTQGGPFKSANPLLSRMSVGAGNLLSRDPIPFPPMLLEKLISYLNNITSKETNPTA